MTEIERNFLEYLLLIYDEEGGENVHEFLGVPFCEYLKWMENPKHDIMQHVLKKWNFSGDLNEEAKISASEVVFPDGAREQFRDFWSSPNKHI